MTWRISWTPERVEKLIDMVKAGKSAAEMAEGLYEHGEAPTRNSVIGFINRRPDIKAIWIRHRPSQSEAGRAAGLKANAQRKQAIGLPARKPAKAARQERIDVTAPAPMMLALEDLSANQCRWPYGDPREPGFGFCGHSKLDGSPYCAWHRRRSIDQTGSRFFAEAAE